MLQLDQVREEIRTSDLSPDAKFLLKWILDGVLLGGEPLFGLLPKPEIKKGRRQYAQLDLAVAYKIRRKRYNKSIAALSELESLGFKKSTIFAAVKAFPD